MQPCMENLIWALVKGYWYGPVQPDYMKQVNLEWIFFPPQNLVLRKIFQHLPPNYLGKFGEILVTVQWIFAFFPYPNPNPNSNPDVTLNRNPLFLSRGLQNLGAENLYYHTDFLFQLKHLLVAISLLRHEQSCKLWMSGTLFNKFPFMLHIRPPDDKGIKEAFPVVWWQGIQVSGSFSKVTVKPPSSLWGNAAMIFQDRCRSDTDFLSLGHW